MSFPYNIYIEQGADFSTTITVSNDDGTPKDLTGFTAASQMRRTFRSLTAVTITAEITDPTNGVITMSIAAATIPAIDPDPAVIGTDDIAAGRYVYDLVISSADLIPVKTRVVEGIATVSPSVSR